MSLAHEWYLYRICSTPKPNYKPTKEDWTFLEWFVHWAPWYLNGKIGPRPKDAPRTIPAEGWALLGEKCVYHKYKNVAPPPPPPSPPPANNPPSRWKDAPWTYPFVAISHGLRSNDGVWTPEQLVDRCIQYGVRAIFAQIGSDCPDPDWAEHARQLHSAGKAKGLKIGIWGRADYAPWDTVKADVHSVLPMDGYKADVEGRVMDPQLPEKLVAEFASLMPLAVVATGGIDDAFGTGAIDSALRFGDYFDFVGQDYYKLGQGLPLTPDGGENFVWWRSTDKNNGKGYRHLPDAKGRWHIPMGMSNAEGCTPMAEQVERWKPYAPHLGWWDAEIIEAYGEWETLAEIIRG